MSAPPSPPPLSSRFADRLVFSYCSTSTSNPVRYPTLVSHLSGPGLAFRDVKMEQDYGAVVDARGDVYLWGRGITDGDSSKGGLKPCLRNMVSLFSRRRS